MDQLNSHKLRHEAKTLICEICAYACKRKYELRTHMLAKHSGAEKQGAVYNCKYCAYTTCYRQALQNHENCKHTKLKEYRCALCSYSSFSSVSLFLHKRKGHGYVPGDKAWLENYVSVEKERNSAELLDFFDKSSVTHRQVEQPSSEEPIRNQGQPSADHSASIESVTDSSAVHIENVFSVVSQEIASESVLGSPPTIGNDPEEYCTLVLTRLSTADCQTPASENKEDVCKSPSSSGLHCQVSQQLPPFSPSLTGEGNSAIADEELEQCDLDESLTCMDRTQMSTGKEDIGVAGASSSPEKKQLLHSRGCLEAIRKHDKEQAESMVLEGRVQMLVVSTKKNRYFCNECSYASSKEADFEHHRQTVCHGTVERRGNQAGDAQSNSKEHLDGHKAKACPGLQGKTQALVAIPLSTPESNSVGQEETENQKASQELKVGAKPGSRDLALNGPGTGDSLSQQTTTNNNPVLDASSVVGLQSHYALQEDGKFACTRCVFKSAREATMERHLSKCEKRQRGSVSTVSNKSRQESLWPEQNVNREDEFLSCPNCHFRCSQKRDLASHQSGGCFGAEEPSMLLQCPHCAFKCKRQQSIMARHMALKHGDKRRRRPVCDSCGKSFACATKLRQHNLRVHHRRPSHFCPQCDFAGFSTDDVRRHQRRCHTNSEALRRPCAHCTAEFSSAAALRIHCRRAHVPQVESERGQAKEPAGATKAFATRYQCHLCGIATKTRRLLAQHLLRVHEDGGGDDKPLRCNTCEFACRHQLVLEQHLRSHGGSRLYKCADCSYSTRNRQKMTWHLRIHTGEKPYGCGQCRYTCTDPLRLKVGSQLRRWVFSFLNESCEFDCIE